MITSTHGIGKILDMTIMLETGTIERFAKVAITLSTLDVFPQQKPATIKRKDMAIRKMAIVI
jgi:hypothetical protein